MPDKKPTDAEIKKALECCISDKDDVCLECPLQNDCFANADGNSEVKELALDLINRLQADRDNYKQIAENQQKIILDKAFENKKLKAEIERLQNSIAVFTNNAVDFANEIDRHRKDKEEAFLFAANIVESEKIVIANTKAEAYKEFAERLKTKASDFEYGKAVWLVHIDNLLKELGTKK